MGDTSFRLTPDFRSGRSEMRLDVRLILILVRKGEVIWRGFRMAFGPVDRTISQTGGRADLIIHDFEIGAGDSEKKLLLIRNLAGHDRPKFISAGTCHCRERQPGVSGGGLDQIVAVAGAPL